MGVVIIFILVITIALIFTTREKEQVPITKEFYCFGTILQLKAFGKNSEKAIKKAALRLTNMDDKMSVFKDYSEISKINFNAGGALQKVSKDTYYVINKAVDYCKLSQGAFDITIRPIVRLWGIGREEERIPSGKEIEEKLKFVNYKDIVLDEESNSVGLMYENQEIDVGGIAKGYAADEVKKIFVKHKIKSALINLGGNVYVLGNKTDGSPWKVGIQNPLGSQGEFVGTVSASNKSIVTSGNYERYFMMEGKKYHHILDTKTGYPSESEIISATIISDLSIDGDGLSTGVYILGVNRALELIESLKGIDAILITKEKKIYITSGIKENFELHNKEFQCANN
jgi:thiamine biosynthesis lipoprotein